ncbi:MAG: PTPA-CTERM sorting domain-containing protein [Cyanobacteria bacterium P01_C01_bin.118]
MRYSFLKIGVSTVTCLIGLTAFQSASNAATIVDPDTFAIGTVLTNAFDGVTLTTRDGLAPGSNARDVLVGTDPGATTGSNVFAQDTGNPTWGNGTFEFLRADFAGGASRVWLDFFANDAGGDSNPQLLAFDSSDNLLQTASVNFVPANEFVTLSVSAPKIAYVAAYWDEPERLQNGGLDNLRYEAVPTPALLPGLIGMGVAAWRKRQQKA